ncbi:DUF2934 domain-containing protein [Roseomonas sp. E05]|uniref:DUF2934 domain-containing protein n=1 Tax=Roseomonas sp. E05 TaxID=3046310 RepID=UPI0024B9DDBC|nr:DUF2934 domain-containing protein [Roseomonas sp. E05]MDJ0389325.1 DUF2934 domain-containing protein [Roseomonas sp. E05]
MRDDLEQRIRERAYFLWLQAGQPEGMAEAHWLEARAALEAAEHEAEEHRLDAEGEDSFPASDPPSHTGITGERAA